MLVRLNADSFDQELPPSWRSSSLFISCLLNRMGLKRYAGSTHCNERNLFIMFIAGNTGRVRIQHRFAVYQKTVLMVTMT